MLQVDTALMRGSQNARSYGIGHKNACSVAGNLRNVPGAHAPAARPRNLAPITLTRAQRTGPKLQAAVRNTTRRILWYPSCCCTLCLVFAPNARRCASPPARAVGASLLLPVAAALALRLSGHRQQQICSACFLQDGFWIPHCISHTTSSLFVAADPAAVHGQGG